MSFQWDDAGSFADQDEVNKWAFRNNIALTDISVRQQGERLAVSVRRSVSEPRGGYNERRGMRDGFF